MSQQLATLGRRRGVGDEPIVAGRPELILADEEREAIAELLAELLIEAIGGGAPAEDAR